MPNRIISIAAINAFIAVAAGAFASHGLKQSMDTYYLDIFHTAADYQMIHALGLFGLGVLYKIQAQQWIKTCSVLMLAGIILFSGSLYILALSELKWLGMITPVGGFCFLLAWLYLAIATFKQEQAGTR